VCWRRAVRIVFTGMLVTGAAEYSSNGQTCGAQGTAVQVLGSGGPDLEDKLRRAAI